ncbi:hypothetical protein ABZY57_02015 [Streptomyces sp. NPDC006450]|uniref:hypothetical protein n=1 Tax=Streptomyces sp. NPDC006450 TaxID=3155458 RepID=UPI00339FADAE
MSAHPPLGRPVYEPADRSVPPSAVVAMEPRDPSVIPRATEPGFATALKDPRAWPVTAAIWGLGVLAAALAVLTFALGFHVTDRSVSKADRDWRPVKAAALVTAGAAALCVTQVRRRDRGRA